MREFSNELRKIVIKVGSSSVSHENGGVDIERIEELAKEIVNLENKGIKVILVSSGAIATGANRLNVKRPRNDISKKQATAAVGQVTLMNTFLKAFAEYGYSIGQILLTRMVETNEVMNFNAKNTINDLLEMGVIPIVNENDTISTYEIDFGDNDTLSSVVAKLVDADLLMLLSDIDGLYTDDPRINKDAKLIKEVNVIDEKLRSMGKDSYSNLGTGGMATKINAANLCMEKGIDTVIANSPEIQKYKGDIAFVGSLYERNSYDKIKSRLPEYLCGYFDAVIEAQLNISGANIVEPMLTTDILEKLQEYFELEKSEGSFSDLGLIFQTTVLGFKIAEVERRRALIELSKHYHVNVYSNSDVSDLLRIQYCGSVDYWSELPQVFRMSKINLNFTIPNIKSGIPLRVWDVLGAGGFLMTNYQAEIPYYFKEGEDLICFDGINDLCEKAGYYLSHEDERRAIAENGYRKVKEHHNYIERINTMLEMIEKNSF